MKTKTLTIDFHTYMEEKTDEYGKGWEAGVLALYKAFEKEAGVSISQNTVEIVLINFCDSEETYHILEKLGIKVCTPEGQE